MDMLNTFFGTKLDSSSAFDQKGSRLAVTTIKTNPLTVTQVKSADKDGYWSVQCAIGTKSTKSLTKPLKNHLKGAKMKQAPRFLREIKVLEEPKLKPGDQIKVTDIFSLNDQVKLTGTTKGKGFTGVIKRWGFHGGPRTHGQSDRQRAPGSIGQGTDPGRVWKGKKMPGHSGAGTKSIRGLQIIKLDADANTIMVTGTVPGARNSLLTITKIGTAKRKLKLFSKKDIKAKAKDTKITKKETKKPTSTKKQDK